MDFLVSQAEPSSIIKARYAKTCMQETSWVCYTVSNNATAWASQGGTDGFVAGPLFGPLCDIKALRRENKKELGKRALKSDGSFAVVVFRGGGLWLITDCGGSIPVYYGYGHKGYAVGTIVHHVAAASGCTTLDKVSAVDYLLNQTVCYPYSWYEDVRVVSPGAISVFSAHGVEQNTYWMPHEHDDLYRAVDERAWGERLGKQVQRAVQQALDGKQKGRVMYSGGMDSRAIMSVIPDDFECIATTVLDGGPGHREYELARRSAQWLGRRLEWIPRPEGYYRSAIEERIDTVGPGWDIRHTHIHGPVQRRFEDADVVFGGYLADTLFKTYYMSNIDRQKGLLRSERLLDPMPDVVKSPNFRSGILHLWNDQISMVRKRRMRHHHRLEQIRPRSAGNWHRLWPLSNLAAFAHYLSTLRMGATLIEPFLFNQTYQLAARMPDPCRVNQKAFRHAFAERMGRAGYLPTSSGRVPRLSNGRVSGALAETAARYLRGWPTIKRGIKRMVGGTYPGPQGPWHPDSNGWYPVEPEKHFQSKENLELLEHRLNAILAKGQASRFFSEKELHPSLQVRALALGFAHPS